MPDLNADEGPRTVFSRPLQRLIVEFRVHLVTGPKGTFRENSPLWSIAATPPDDAAEALRLAANGFRAAVGRESDREALMQYLDHTAGIRMKMDQVTPDIDKPVQVELGSCGPFRSVFYYDRRGRLHGMELVNAVARMILRFEMRSTNLKEVWISVTPEVEEPPGPPKWERMPDGAMREQPQRRVRTLSDLTLGAQIPEGGFLVIGPNATTDTIPVLGRTFFADQETAGAGGLEEPRERIYIVSPIVRFAGEATPAKGGS